MDIRLKKAGPDSFDDIYGIMQEAFPSDEIRTYEKQRGLLALSDYSLYGAHCGGRLCGMIGTWTLNEVNFIEHLAVSKYQRSKGLGSLIMKQYTELSLRPVILEVEDNDKPLSDRRKQFYRRLGFKESCIAYTQPCLQGSKPTDIPLRIMYMPSCLSNEIIERSADEIFDKIYRVKRI